MQKAKSNGQTGPAMPAVVEPRVTPPPDPFDQVRALMQQHGVKQYAEGYRAAIRRIAPVIGQLDNESKMKLAKTLDILEADLHEAERITR